MSVPQGWKEAKSQDGRTYYYNTITKETSWSLPKPPSEERHVDVTQSKIDKLIENEINLNRLLEEILTHLRSKGENKFVKKAVKIFKQSDADKSGKLSPEEFVVMMKEIGQDLTIQEATQQIQQFDVNDDGLMDVNEFLAFLGY